MHRGHFYLEMKHSVNAIADFQKAVELDPKNRKNFIFLSELLFNSGKYNELIECEKFLVIY